MSSAVAVIACPKCGIELPPTRLACPSCHALVYAERLRELASQAEAAAAAGDVNAARLAWREALELLPAGTKQRDAIAAKVEALGRQPAEAKQENAKARRGGPIAAIGTVLLVVLSKAKFLLLGLTKLGTLLSMFATMGLYWTMYGWQFAVLFVLGIYVHEMGHVAALRQVGLPATAPMFVPGLGAFVRLKQRPATPSEDAYVGLAGPWWGLGAGAACAGMAAWTHAPIWSAAAQATGWVNLFNLIPIASLDGSRGLAAISRPGRWLIVAAAGALFWVSDVGMSGGVALVAAFRALATPAPPVSDRRALGSFLALLTLLTALAALHGGSTG